MVERKRRSRERGHIEPSVRFWSKVDKTQGGLFTGPSLLACWLWTASVNGAGYGRFGVGGEYGGSMLAHRWAYEDANGPVPAGKVLMHECDNPRCVNPHHLQAGTVRENVLDAVHKGRAYFGFRVNPPCGERNIKAKVTEAEVRRIRRLVACGVSRRALVVRFGLSKAALGAIVTGRTWTHVA